MESIIYYSGTFSDSCNSDSLSFVLGKAFSKKAQSSMVAQGKFSVFFGRDSGLL